MQLILYLIKVLEFIISIWEGNGRIDVVLFFLKKKIEIWVEIFMNNKLSKHTFQIKNNIFGSLVWKLGLELVPA